MVILNGKEINKMNAANSGYTPLKWSMAKGYVRGKAEHQSNERK